MSISKLQTIASRPPRRSVTLAVGIAAIGAAWVLTACDTGWVAPVVMAAIPAAAAADKPPATARRDAASEPIFGEVSSIEPINPKAASNSRNSAGYRIHIRLEMGGTRSFEQHHLNGLDVGARVRVEGTKLKQV